MPSEGSLRIKRMISPGKRDSDIQKKDKVMQKTSKKKIERMSESIGDICKALSQSRVA